ncbi:MAG: type II secretion system F family protein [Gammaproteobacteria bacterium]|nr:type II secretion system F family protein [Gammaproteobacteria bacterium]
MAIYRYKAMNRRGRMIQGRLVAVNASELETRLGNMELDLITCREITTGAGYIGGRRVTRQDLINFCFHMEQLLRAGVPILAALGDLRDSMDNLRLREMIVAMIASIEGGKTLSEAMEEFPRIFNTVFVNLIRAGEHSGRLSDVLANLAESLKWQDELISHTRKLAMYPAFVGLVVVAVVFFLMIYLVPQLVGFIRNMGGELPLHTRALLALSSLFIHYWHVILLAPVAVVLFVRYLARISPAVSYRLDDLKLRLFIVGPILRKIILSRFASYFSLLYSSGVPVLSCMKISEDIAGNRVVAAALAKVTRLAAEGKTLSESIESVALFPPLLMRMLKVGESTGRLDVALNNVSYFYNRDVRDSIERLQTIIEPVMTVVLGLILGWVMLSVLGPVYDMISKIRA